MTKVTKYSDPIRFLMAKASHDLEEAWHYVQHSLVYDAPVVQRRVDNAKKTILALQNALHDTCTAHKCEMEQDLDEPPSVYVEICKHCGKKETMGSWA